MENKIISSFDEFRRETENRSIMMVNRIFSSANDSKRETEQQSILTSLMLIGSALLAIPLNILLVLYKAFVVMTVWNWIMPATLGILSLSYPAALALMFISFVFLMRAPEIPKKEPTQEEALATLVSNQFIGWVSTTSILFYGFLLSFFI